MVSVTQLLAGVPEPSMGCLRRWISSVQLFAGEARLLGTSLNCGQVHYDPKRVTLNIGRHPPCNPPCVTFRLVVVSLQGPGQSPVLPFQRANAPAAQSLCLPVPRGPSTQWAATGTPEAFGGATSARRG